MPQANRGLRPSVPSADQARPQFTEGTSRRRSRPTARGRIRPVLLVASAALLFTAGCGGSDDDAGGQNQANGQNAFSAYIDCLNDNGVSVSMPSNAAGGARGTARPSGEPGNGPSGRPTAWASGRPTAGASGQPGNRPSGQAGQPGGGMMGNLRPEGVDDATWQKAQEACQSLMPTGGPGGGDRQGGNGGENSALAAYRNCLTENGVTISGRIEDLDSSDATVAAALTKCEPLKPSTTTTPTAGPTS